MGKTIVIGIAGILLIGMTVFNVSNLKTLNSQKTALTSKAKQVNNLVKDLDLEKLENEILVDKNVELEIKIVELRDSISMLKYELKSLKSDFAYNKSEILDLKNVIAAHEAKYASLQTEISNLNSVAQTTTTYEQVAVAQSPIPDFGRGGLEYAIADTPSEGDIILTAKGGETLTVSRKLIEEQELVQKERDMALAKIQRLESESVLLRAEIDSLYNIKHQKLVETKEIKEVIKDRTESEMKFERLAAIVNQTLVSFNKVSLRKARYGKPISKIGGRNWRYTVIEIGLEGIDKNLLLDGTFMIKILDQDKKSLVTYLEANTNYPYNTIEKDGVEVKFDGNLIEVVHHNNFKKFGENYEIIINYVDATGEEFTLLNGVKQIVKAGIPLLD